MTAEKTRPVEMNLCFQENPRGSGARLVAYLGAPPRAEIVLLGVEHEKSIEVQPGETWRSRVHQKATVKVAEPLERVAPGPLVQAMPVPRGRRSRGAAPSKDGGSGFGGVVGAGEAVAVIVDGPSVEKAQASLGWSIDWSTFMGLLVGPGLLNSAIYFTLDKGGADQSQSFRKLSNAGFSVRRHRPEAEDSPGDIQRTLAVMLTAETVNRVPQYHVVFLVTRDPALVGLARQLSATRRRVFVVTWGDGPAALMLEVDKPVYYLEDLQALVLADDTEAGNAR